MRNFLRNLWTSLRRGVIAHPWITVAVILVCIIGIYPELGDKLLEVLFGICERALTLVANKFIGFLNRNSDTIGSLIILVVLGLVIYNMVTAPFRKRRK